MTEHATPDFRLRFTALPCPVRGALVAIAKSPLADEVDASQHEQLLINLIAVVDADFGEATRIEMGWCLEQLDDLPIAQWVADQVCGSKITSNSSGGTFD
jgi:hypothetical protein